MSHFLLVYDRSRAELLLRRDFAPSDFDEAWRERNRLTLEYLAHPEVEVVLLGSDSEETLRRTHGRYFEGPLNPA